MAENNNNNQPAIEQPVETEVERKLRFTRNCRHFIDYINYDWDSDEKWQEFQKTNMKDIKEPKQIEEIKREYFRMNINRRLNTAFMLETEDEKNEFLDICKYIGTCLSLSQIFKSQGSTARTFCHLKHIFYFLYLVCFPLRGKLPTFTFHVSAYVCSLIQRKISVSKKKEDSMVALMMADEEAMHFFWFLTYVLMSWQIRLPVDMMLLIWAYLNTCEWFDYLLHAHPNLPILPLLAGPIQIVQDNLVTIVLIKNYIEVLLVPVSLVAWMSAWCAPILGVILVQCIRIKFLGSNFTRAVLRGIDEFFLNVLGETVYGMIVSPVKSLLCSLSGVKEALEQQEAGQDQADQIDSSDGKKKPAQSGKATDNAFDSDDEPKTYEVGPDDDIAESGKKPYKRQGATSRPHDVTADDLD